MTGPIVQDSSPDFDQIDSKPHLSHATTNISLSPELFEKLYLQPKVPHASENVKKYANATPLGFLGYIVSPSPSLKLRLIILTVAI